MTSTAGFSKEARSLVKAFQELGWHTYRTKGGGGHIAICLSPNGVDTVAVQRKPRGRQLANARADLRRAERKA